jgi:hypothetical protein
MYVMLCARRRDKVASHVEGAGVQRRGADGLLRALRARGANHPERPWLVACWPGVQEEQMAAACGELMRRGHAITNVPLAGRRRGAARSGWTVATDNRSARADAGANQTLR